LQATPLQPCRRTPMTESPHNVGATFTVAHSQRDGAYWATVGCNVGALPATPRMRSPRWRIIPPRGGRRGNVVARFAMMFCILCNDVLHNVRRFVVGQTLPQKGRHAGLPLHGYDGRKTQH